MQQIHTSSSAGRASPETDLNAVQRQLQHAFDELFQAAAIMSLVKFTTENMPALDSKWHEPIVCAVGRSSEASANLTYAAIELLEDLKDTLGRMPQ